MLELCLFTDWVTDLKLFFLLLITSFLLLLDSCSEPTTNYDEFVYVGVLLSTPSELDIKAITARAALNLAADSLTTEYLKRNIKKKVSLLFENVGKDTNLIRLKLNEFSRRGIKIVIGPFFENQLRIAGEFASQSGMLIIAPYSTNSSLSAPDNIFRLGPNDIQLTKALSAWLEMESKKRFVVLRRPEPLVDIYYEDLKGNLKGSIHKEISYSPGDDYIQVIIEFDNWVKDAIDVALESGVGIIYLPQNEAYEIFDLTKKYESVNKVDWFTGGYFMEMDIISNRLTQAAIAQDLNLIVATTGPNQYDRDNWDRIGALIKEESGFDTDYYALSCFDILMIAIHSLDKANNGDLNTMKSKFIETAEENLSFSGSMKFDQNGDRENSLIYFYRVAVENNQVRWKVAGDYKTESGEIKKY